MHRRAKYILLIIIAITYLFSGCSKNENVKTLRLAHNLTAGHPVAKAIQFLSQRTNELSNGNLSIKIYEGGQLGSEQQNIEMLQIGSLAMTKISAAALEGFASEYKVLGLPYIFKSKQHYFNVCDGKIGQAILESTKSQWLKGMGFYDAGSRSFYAKKHLINTPDDLKGMKIRVMQSQTAMKMVDLLGGAPTPLAWGELYTALQSNVVDGAENNPPTFLESRHYEVCKFLSLDEHASIPDVLVMSLKVWDKLNPEEQATLQQAVEESVIKERQLWKTAEENALLELKKAGVEISYPDKTLFYEKAKIMYLDYKDDPILWPFIEQITALENE